MAVDMYLKIGDIKGESKESAHRDWIELSSWSWGVSQTGTVTAGAGGGAGKVSVQDLTVTKSMDKSSPLLMLSCATGQHLEEATLQLSRNRNDKQTYLTVKMNDVLVSSYQSASSSGGSDNLPVEEITLNFGKIEMVYSEIDCSTNRVIGEHRASHTIKF